MTDATPEQIGAAADKRLGRLRAGLKRRHARETRFKLYGQLAIAAAVLGFNLLGDGLRDWFDPKLQEGR